MFSRIRPMARSWALALAMASTLLVHCSGTEADNPVADAVVTACKSASEYDPNQLDEFAGRVRETRTARAESPSISKNYELIGTLPRALTRAADMPLGLSCVEWQLTDNLLEVQVFNVRSGCGAEFQAQTTREGDRVTLLLENSTCTIAPCGNCLYDTATAIELASVSDVTFAVSLDESCDGSLEGEEWSLPLTREPQGMICGFARSLDGNLGQPFTWCTFDGSCDGDLFCTDTGNSGDHCLPACTSDDDCPFAGGTRCEAERCVPTVSRDYF